MKLKQQPQDFVVEEVSEFVRADHGRYHIFRLWKRGLSTLEVLDIIARRYRVSPGTLQVCGLKDKYAESVQLLSAQRSFPTENHDPRWSLTYLGRSETPMGSDQLIGNRFSLTIRDLSPDDVSAAAETISHVAQAGIPNYFDSQRFGSARHFQGFSARQLIAGNFEGAVRLFLTARSGKDRGHVRRRKMRIENEWGRWDDLAHSLGRCEERPVVFHLAKNPGDWAGAFAKINRQLRALHLFAYQSFIWNEAAKRLLERHGLRHRAADYVMGDLFFHGRPNPWLSARLDLEMPMLSHTTTFSDPDVCAAVEATVAAEGLTIDEFRIDDAQRLYFKEIPRSFLLRPLAIDWQPLGPDALNRGKHAGQLTLTLPPGAYATLFVKRIFQTTSGPDAETETETEGQE